MPNYNQPHQFYAGVDLHARSMFVHVLSAKGKTVFERDLHAEPDAFLDAVKPFRKNLVVGCECMFGGVAYLSGVCHAFAASGVCRHCVMTTKAAKACHPRFGLDLLGGNLCLPQFSEQRQPHDCPVFAWQ
jgi:hypothetical protein